MLIGIAFNSVHFLMGEPYMLRAFVVIVLGGLGSIGGAVIAGLLLGLIQTMTIAYLSSDLSDAIIFSLLFLILLVRPTGFFGTLRRERQGGPRMTGCAVRLSVGARPRAAQLRTGVEPVRGAARGRVLGGHARRSRRSAPTPPAF